MTLGPALGSWLLDQLLPSLGDLSPVPDGISPNAAFEYLLLRGLAGVKPASGLPSFEWEGFNYRLDLAAPRLARVLKVRQRQAGNSFDAVMRLFQVIGGLSAANPDLQSIERARTELMTISNALRQPQAETAIPVGNVANIPNLLTRAIERLGRIREARQAPDARDVAEDLGPAAEYTLAHVLRSIAYAPYLGDPSNPLLLDGDVAQRHDLGFLTEPGAARQKMMWAPPAVLSESAPWHIQGSIVGIDLALGYLAMPQTVAGAPPEVPLMKPEDRDAFLRMLGAVNPFRMSDAGGRAIAAAIRRGRTKGLATDPDGPVSQWIINARAWARIHEPEAVAALTSVAEWFWQGRDAVQGTALDGWGAFAGPTSGCWCWRVIVSQPWDTVAQELPGSEKVSYTPDLMFRLAELVDDLKLPTQVTAEIMPRIVQDLIDQAQLGDPDDWTSLLRYIQLIDRERVEDYVSALAAGGALVPATGESQ